MENIVLCVTDLKYSSHLKINSGKYSRTSFSVRLVSGSGLNAITSFKIVVGLIRPSLGYNWL